MENMAAERTGSAHTLPPDVPLLDNETATEGMFDPAMMKEMNDLKEEVKKMAADAASLRESTQVQVEQLKIANKKLIDENGNFKVKLERLLPRRRPARSRLPSLRPLRPASGKRKQQAQRAQRIAREMRHAGRTDTAGHRQPYAPRQ